MSGFEMPWTDGVADYVAEVEVTGRYTPATYWQPADYPDVEVTSLRLDPTYGRRSRRSLTDWHRHARELEIDAQTAAGEFLRDVESWHGHMEGYDDD